MIKKIYIYSLSDPITKEIRYIGKTIQNPQYRLSSHISQSKHNAKKDYCHCWIRSLLNKNLKPLLALIEETYDINREAYWIKFYRDKDLRLTNFTDGGDLGNLGKTWKISEDKIHIYKFKNNKPINQYDLQGNFIKEWISGREFERFYNLSKSVVSNSINQKVSCNGFLISFKEDLFNINDYSFYKPLFIQDVINKKYYHFKTAKEASRVLNLNNSSICKVAKSGKILYKRFKISNYDFMSE